MSIDILTMPVIKIFQVDVYHRMYLALGFCVVLFCYISFHSFFYFAKADCKASKTSTSTRASALSCSEAEDDSTRWASARPDRTACKKKKMRAQQMVVR